MKKNILIGVLLLITALQSTDVSIRAVSLVKLQKFRVTFGSFTKDCNGCTIPPIEVMANDRVDALMKAIPITVWTEDEWDEKLHQQFLEICKENKN